MDKKGKKVYERGTHFCIFCKKEIVRAASHFKKMHKAEAAVRAVLYVENRRERYWAWRRLTQQGDYYFNVNVVDSSKARKTVKKPGHITKSYYFTCETCFSRIRTTSRRGHRLICSQMLKKNHFLPIIESSQEDFFNGIPEQIINKARASKSLLAFFQHCFKVKRNKIIVRSLVKELLVLEKHLQEKTHESKSLIFFLNVDQVDNFVAVIKNLCEQQIINKEKLFRYPFKAIKLYEGINDLCKFVISYYSEKSNDISVSEVTKFHSTFQVEAGKKIKSVAFRTNKLRRLKQRSIIPKTNDIDIWVRKLKRETPQLISALIENPKYSSWKSLAENILCRLTIFNRGRGKIVQKMKVAEYNNIEIKSKKAIEETLLELDEEDKEFLKNIKVVEVIHRCNKIAPVYLNKSIQDAIDILNQYRDSIGINKDNKHVFGTKRYRPMAGTDVLRKLRDNLPEKIRKLLTVTKLRKHGGTVTKLLDLSCQEKQEWADHLKMTVKVYDQYHGDQLVNDILKIGRILTALDEGTLKFYEGKKLKDISFKLKKEAS